MKKSSLLKRCLSSLLAGALVIGALSGFAFAPNDILLPSGPIFLSGEADVSPNVIPSGGKVQDEPSTSAPGTPTTPSTTSKNQGVPMYDLAIKSGKPFALQITAPAGATVTATINGNSYELSHGKSNVKDSTYVAFKRNYTIPSAEGTEDLGNVVYRITYKDKTTTYSSAGSLFSVGENATLKVQIKNNSLTVFNKAVSDKSSGYRTIARAGAVDTVVDYKGDMYKLGSGGWVNASGVTPSTKNLATVNTVSSTGFSRNGKTETITLTGTAHPMFTANYANDKLVLHFARTSGVGTINVSDSRILSKASSSTSDGWTSITLTPSSSGSIWGYCVEYSGGETKIVLKAKPTLSEGSQPLSGVTIALDPGHGGSDNGTSGIASSGNWVEKDANLATANAVKRKLEEQGATVVMLRSNDSKVELSNRLDAAQRERVDLLISLHCNSAANKNATGVEIYYHHPNSASLAKNMLSKFTAATDRTTRKVVQSHYIISLGSQAPSILLEMGFMTNVGEYNDLVSKEGIDNAATGVVDGIIATLS